MKNLVQIMKDTIVKDIESHTHAKFLKVCSRLDILNSSQKLYNSFLKSQMETVKYPLS